MIQQIPVSKMEIECRKFCDDCGDRIFMRGNCSEAKCQYCKADLCNKCIAHEEDTSGDYREVFCRRCWEIGTAYLLQINELTKERDRLYEEWQLKCRENTMKPFPPSVDILSRNGEVPVISQKGGKNESR